MDFASLTLQRQSCRNFDPNRPVEEDKLLRVLEAGRMSPSACNSQPYHITVCTGETAQKVAHATMGMGMNKFADKAPVMLVITQEEYNATAAIGAKVKRNDYRSIDIGILAATLTYQAADEGLATCILGWFEDEKIREICGLNQPVRLVIPLGYAAEGDPLRTKKRKPLSEMTTRL
ncbi:MAG: nitroreductase [Clostridiales bacterium]|nr:nitroreductase [Clostridiales bacterium]